MNIDRVNGVVVVGVDSNWKFLEDGSDPGPKWNTFNFDDRPWRAGRIPFAYGMIHAGTEVDYGTDENNKHITNYFRTVFDVSSTILAQVEVGTIELQYDDGVIVYINGEEVGRAGMVSVEFLFRNKLCYN